MLTSSNFGDAHQYEVMIWLAALDGAGPISSSYNAQGAVPVATGLTIAGPSGYKKARVVAHSCFHLLCKRGSPSSVGI